MHHSAFRIPQARACCHRLSCLRVVGFPMQDAIINGAYLPRPASRISCPHRIFNGGVQVARAVRPPYAWVVLTRLLVQYVPPMHGLS